MWNKAIPLSGSSPDAHGHTNEDDTSDDDSENHSADSSNDADSSANDTDSSIDSVDEVNSSSVSSEDSQQS
jgi:hypothetical protein